MHYRQTNKRTNEQTIATATTIFTRDPATAATTMNIHRTYINTVSGKSARVEPRL